MYCASLYIRHMVTWDFVRLVDVQSKCEHDHLWYIDRKSSDGNIKCFHVRYGNKYMGS